MVHFKPGKGLIVECECNPDFKRIHFRCLCFFKEACEITGSVNLEKLVSDSGCCSPAKCIQAEIVLALFSLLAVIIVDDLGMGTELDSPDYSCSQINCSPGIGQRNLRLQDERHGCICGDQLGFGIIYTILRIRRANYTVIILYYAVVAVETILIEIQSDSSCKAKMPGKPQT